MLSVYTFLVVYGLSLCLCPWLMKLVDVEKQMEDAGLPLNYNFVKYTLALIPCINTGICIACVTDLIREYVVLAIVRKILKKARDRTKDEKAKEQLQEFIDKIS